MKDSLFYDEREAIVTTSGSVSVTLDMVKLVAIEMVAFVFILLKM